MKRWLARTLLWSPIAVIASVPFLPDNVVVAIVGALPVALVPLGYAGLVLLLAAVAGWRVVRRHQRLRRAAAIGAAVGASPLIGFGIFLALASIFVSPDGTPADLGWLALAACLGALAGAMFGSLGGWLALRADARHAT